jgi:hypothetical protein
MNQIKITELDADIQRRVQGHVLRRWNDRAVRTRRILEILKILPPIEEEPTLASITISVIGSRSVPISSLISQPLLPPRPVPAYGSSPISQSLLAPRPVPAYGSSLISQSLLPLRPVPAYGSSLISRSLFEPVSMHP